MVVRFQGGHNAGHTIVTGGKTYKLSLLPSNILREGKISVIGNGVVVDPIHLLSEIESISSNGIKIDENKLYLAENCCLILSIHKAIDALEESIKQGTKIGTTGRGIGPAYSDKVGRRAIRVCDLDDPKVLERKVSELLNFYGPILQKHSQKYFSRTEILEELASLKETILPYSKPVWKILNEFKKEGKKIMFEGAQGVMLDIDHGTYPFVTSSNTVTPQAFAGSGLGVSHIESNIGVVKAYTTRVGEGPFPTELSDATGAHLQEKGHEFGTATGRDRRCGWLDLVQLKQMIQICGINSIALTKMDVLSELDEIKICYEYEIEGKRYDYLPASERLQKAAKPIYKSVEGWKVDIVGLKKWEHLPAKAQKFVKIIEQDLEIPIDVVSTGPAREDTIILKDYFA